MAVVEGIVRRLSSRMEEGGQSGQSGRRRATALSGGGHDNGGVRAAPPTVLRAAAWAVPESGPCQRHVRGRAGRLCSPAVRLPVPNVECHSEVDIRVVALRRHVRVTNSPRHDGPGPSLLRRSTLPDSAYRHAQRSGLSPGTSHRGQIAFGKAGGLPPAAAARLERQPDGHWRVVATALFATSGLAVRERPGSRRPGPDGPGHI